MQIEVFKASTKYGDFKGTSAADGGDMVNATKFLQDSKLINDGEFLVGIEIGTGEMHGNFDGGIAVTFFLCQPGDYDTVNSMINATNGPVVVRRVHKDMHIADFMKMFKRFSVSFSRHAMLEGREVTSLNY
ncbi:MAG: hypothetical protein V4731_15235 [Pseudomonadota bacterium]